MIAAGKDAGSKGEAFAARILAKQGYKIVARNFRSRYGEIDLIARKGKVLAFVEIKTRAADGMGRPRDAVNRAKRRRIISTALMYLQQYPEDLQPRFDIFEIIIEKSEEFRVRSYTYMENAFGVGEDHSFRFF